jgi:hypothetical protein
MNFAELCSIVMVSSARTVFRSASNNREEDIAHSMRLYRILNLARHSNNPAVFEMLDENQNDDLSGNIRQTKAITKGDPREFMG